MPTPTSWKPLLEFTEELGAKNHNRASRWKAGEAGRTYGPMAMRNVAMDWLAMDW